MSERLWGIPPTWEWSRIDELGKVVSGGTPSTKVSEYWEGDIIWFAPSDLTGYKRKFIERGAKTLTREGLAKSSAKLMPAGSVMFSSRAPVGYTAINTEPATTNQGFKSIIPHDGLFNEYIYYYLQAAKQIAEQRATGTTFKELSGSAFGALPIPIAPICEQHGIVEKIEALFAEIDKGVESLKAAKASLDHYRKSLLKAAFEGRLTADWRARNPDKLEDPQTLLSRIRKEREAKYRNALAEWEQAIASWKESGEKGKKPAKPKPLSKFTGPNESERSGELVSPKDWLYLPLADLGQISGGLTKNQRRNDLPLKASYLRVANVYSNFLDLSEIKKIGITTDELNKTRLQAGDILFVEGNGSIEQIGRVAVWDDNIADMSHQNHLIRFRVDGSLLPSFALHFLMSPEGRSLVIAQASSTSGLHTLSISKVESLRVPICSPAEQTEIVRILDERLGAADALEADVNASLEYSGALRQSILKQAFSGKLVPQDPGDEPAAALLDRIKAQRAKKPPKPKPRKRKAAHP